MHCKQEVFDHRDSFLHIYKMLEYYESPTHEVLKRGIRPIGASVEYSASIFSGILD
jgi:hypothetical protein